MNDLISRQAAIDELDKIPIRGMKEDGKFLHALVSIAQVWNMLEQLPSAQRWIPCSERLPNGRLNKSYLVQDKDGRRAVGTYTYWGWVFGYYMNDPIAWMPLPPSFKEE